MQICKDHWAKLRQAMVDRSIDHLGAKSGEEAHADMASQLQGEETEYDPLMSCHWMIFNKGLEHGGLYMLGPKDDGTPHCPICEAIEHKPEDVTVEEAEDFWINGPADAALHECRDRNLVPSQQ